MIEDIGKDEKATALAKAASATNEQALALLVRSPHEYEQASAFLSNIKAKFKEIDGYRTYLKEPYLEGGRRVDEFFRSPLQFLKTAEAEAKSKLLGYEQEQRRVAAEEQRKLEEKARKEREALEEKARKEREKSEAEVAEIIRKANEARKAGDLAAAVTLQHQANKNIEKSEIKAEAALSKAAQIVAPTVNAYIPPIAGQSTKTVWKAKVIDAKSVPDEYKIVNEKMLDQVANATKGKLQVLGVEFYEERIMSARAAR